MTLSPYRILARKRAGEALSDDEIAAVVAGAAAEPGTPEAWAEAQLGAFLMAAAIRGLGRRETEALTRGMLHSGDSWRLADELPGLCDKHSTGGVGDKVSLVLSPLLAACGRPVAMLTGRGLGHTGGTADKLEALPGIDLELDRRRTVRLLGEVGLAIGVATGEVAPADRRFYSLRDVTATIDSIPLITASILSKKLAAGAAGVAYDVKVGSGAFLPEPERARQLADSLVRVSADLGTPARALLTDMSQPLGRWAGHGVEVTESLACLAGDGPEDLTALCLALSREAAAAAGVPLDDGELEAAIASGAARERFERWAAAQGAEADWQQADSLRPAPVEMVARAPHRGHLTAVDTRELGLLLAEAGGGRARPGDTIDHRIALRFDARLGDEVAAGDPLARLYLRGERPEIVERVAACFTLGEERVEPPPLIRETVG